MKDTFKVLAQDGYTLACTRFSPQKSNGKLVLISSATGVKQKFYADFAAFLATQGYFVYSYDYRGIGSSRPADLKTLQNNMRDWATLDLDAMIAYVTNAYPQLELVLVGHSVGGQLVGLSNLAAKASAFVMIASQTPYFRNFGSGWTMAKIILFWYVYIPFFTRLFGYFPASKLGLFEDLPINVARQWARWAKTPNYVFDEYPELSDRFSALDHSTLMISFSDDYLAPIDAVRHFRSFYPTLNVLHHHFTPAQLMMKRIGHFGFFRKQMEPTLWPMVTQWLETQTVVIS